MSRAALIMSESPIFLLDAFTNLIVYYSPTADPSIAFPPPRDCEYIIFAFCYACFEHRSTSTCLFQPPFLFTYHAGLLRTTINRLKQDRCITPKLTFIHGGKDDSTLFESYLIEEQDVDGSGFTTGSGFVAFRESVRNVAAEIIQEEIGS